jgi:DNA-binding HxlR family transcriptional regulator
MRIVNNEMPYIPDLSLSEWDTNVLDLISYESLTRFTFDGLKRRLGVHPETLSRALSRLEEQGMLEKQVDGYRVTSKAAKSSRLQPLGKKQENLPLLQTLLPPDVPVKQVIKDLAGKWFGTLRWFGFAENGESITLKWITEDGGIQLDADFSDGALSIEAKMLSGNNMNDALLASYQLMGYISKMYSRSGRVQHVAFFTNFGANSTMMWM